MQRIKTVWNQWQSFSLWKRISLYLIVFIVLLLMILPYVIEWSLEAWMKHEGAKEARIQDVDLNVFRGRIAIKGLYAEVGDRPPLELGYVNFNLQWLALLKQRVAIKTLEVHNVKAEVILSPEQAINVGGFKIPLGSKDTPNKDEEETNWGIGIQTLSLVDSTVHIVKPKFDKEIDFHRVSLSNFESWEPDQPARLSFDIDVGEGTFVGNFDLKYFDKTRVADGTVIFDDVFLQSYQPLFNEQLAIADAQLDGRLSVVVKHTPENDHVTVTNRGYLEINKLHLQQPLSEGQLASQADLLRWEGYFKVDYTPDNLIYDTGSRITLKNGQYQTSDLSALLSSIQIDGQYNGHYRLAQKDTPASGSASGNARASGTKEESSRFSLVTDQTIQVGKTQIGLSNSSEANSANAQKTSAVSPNKNNGAKATDKETQTHDANHQPSNTKPLDTATDKQTDKDSQHPDPVKTLSKTLSKTLDATHTGRVPAATEHTDWIMPKQRSQTLMFNHLMWKGKTEVEQKNSEGGLNLSSDGQLTVDSTNVHQLGQNVKVARLQWNGPIQFNKHTDTLKVNLSKGKATVKQVVWQQTLIPNAIEKAKQGQGDDQTLSIQSAAWEGIVTWDTKGQENRLSNTSDLTLEALNFKKGPMSISLRRLGYKTKVAMQPVKQDQELNTDDQINAKDLRLTLDALSIHGQNVIWNGQTHTTFSGNSQNKDAKAATGPRVDVKGNASLVQGKLNHKALVAETQRADWGGQIRYRPQTKQEVVVKGQGRMAKTSLRNPKEKVTVVALDSLKTHIDFITPRDVGLSEFEMLGLEFAQRKQDKRALAKVQRTKIDTFRMPDETNLKLGNILLSGLDADIQMTADQKIPPLDTALSAMDSKESQAVLTEAKKKIQTLEMTHEEAQSQGKTKLNLQIKSLSVKGKNRVVASTATTEPPVSKTIEIEKAHIGEMDTDKPRQYTPFEMGLKIDKYSTTALIGKAQLFNPKVNADIKARIDDLNLYSFSPLIQKYLGYRIQSGSLNLNSNTNIKNDDLVSKNHLVLTGFEMEADSPQEVTPNASETSTAEASKADIAEKDSGGQAIPPFALKLGLDMLRDNNGKIEMDLPVKGNLNDPSFDVSSALSSATKNVLKTGTKVALTLALQPFGSIVMASEFLYGQMSKIKFEPVVFEVGKAQMQPRMYEYLDKLTKVMKDKKTITLKVCGYFNADDESYWQKEGLKDKALTQKLKELAQARQQLVKDGLIRRGIASNRMTTCYPDRENNAKPGVSLSM